MHRLFVEVVCERRATNLESGREEASPEPGWQLPATDDIQQYQLVPVPAVDDEPGAWGLLCQPNHLVFLPT
jgi:hypothetical protein